MTPSYVLIAVALHFTTQSTPLPPTVTNLGQYTDAAACSAAQQSITAAIQDELGFVGYPPISLPTLVLKCEPTSVPAEDIPSSFVYQRAEPTLSIPQ